jgi:hypothetical protein
VELVVTVWKSQPEAKSLLTGFYQIEEDTWMCILQLNCNVILDTALIQGTILTHTEGWKEAVLDNSILSSSWMIQQVLQPCINLQTTIVSCLRSKTLFHSKSWAKKILKIMKHKVCPFNHSHSFSLQKFDFSLPLNCRRKSRSHLWKPMLIVLLICFVILCNLQAVHPQRQSSVQNHFIRAEVCLFTDTHASVCWCSSQALCLHFSLNPSSEPAMPISAQRFSFEFNGNDRV